MEYIADMPFTIMDVASLLRLNIRRRMAGQVYVDCPICGDRRGKMNINLTKGLWRCNYCGEGGGMLALYAKVHGVSTSVAYQEICDALQTGGTAPAPAVSKEMAQIETVPQSERADAQTVHRTMSALLSLLTLTPAHREHLRTKRGLTDGQIDRFGFRSTPPPQLCRHLTERLLEQGYTVRGIPGFYMNDSGRWTVKFHRRTSGILIPILGADGLIHGAQIRLDHPIKNRDDPPERSGTKYLPLSSANKNMGTTSGSPVHFIGDPFSRVVYVTEGALKADIAHALTGRTFAATAGANNTAGLDPLFALLRRNGVEEVIEAEDMDKYRNQAVSRGASKVWQLAHKHGLACRRLIWDPNYKGIDDWQLALRREREQKKEAQEMKTGPKYSQKYRVYQLDLNGVRTYPFAFQGIEAMRAAGYEQPPAEDYVLVFDGEIGHSADDGREMILERIFIRCNNDLPSGYRGHRLAASDVVELYDSERRAFFYCNSTGFVPVRFAPGTAAGSRE